MKKPRLLALTTSYPLRPGSSAGVFVQSLYRALSAAYTIDVVCPADTHPTASVFDDPSAVDIRVHAVRYAPAAWRTLAQASGGVVTRLRRAPWYAVLLPALLLALFWRTLVRARHTDVIHANWAACGLLAGLVGRLCRNAGAELVNAWCGRRVLLHELDDRRHAGGCRADDGRWPTGGGAPSPSRYPRWVASAA